MIQSRIHRPVRWAVLLLIVFAGLCLGGCQARTGTNQTTVVPGESRQEAMDPVVSGQADDKAEDMPARKVSWQVQVAMEADDVEAAMQTIEKICLEQGGYVVSSSLNRKDDRYGGEVTIKVPGEKMEEIADRVSQQGQLLSRTVQGRDVTEEYYDAQARLKVMQAKEERLIALLAKSSSIKDLLEVEKELGVVRTDIETLQGRIKLLENTTSYASIRVVLSQTQPAYLQTPSTLSGKAGRTLVDSVNTMAALFGSLIIGLVYLLPWLPVVGLIYLGIRKVRGRKAAK